MTAQEKSGPSDAPLNTVFTQQNGAAGCEPGGGSASFADGFVKGRDVSVLARRLRRGEVRSLALSRARLSSLQWAALAEGVATPRDTRRSS
ncbi:hypothetical protein DIPPA_21280 [Diplonema papillatum]|nr:hypothetical protein DIPPA_21280 [Diplonema papillatum]